MPRRAAIYTRISKDGTGQGAGVGRQQADCLALAERRRWPVVEVFVDNDQSAYSGKARPAYRRMLEALKAGDADAVVVWHPDRLHRSPRELEDFIDLIEATGAAVATCTSGDYDLATPDGRLMARIVGGVARKESEDKSRRILRMHEDLASSGRGKGGGTRPFGYQADRLSVNSAEAQHITEAAERLLAGDTVRGICADWNARGIGTVTGVRWWPHVFKTVMASGRIAGLREHRGEITAKAEWAAIIDERTHRRLRALLTDPSRRTNRVARRYLLTGLLRCGRCGAKLVARPKDDGRRRYVCARGPGFEGCNRIHVLAEPVEACVVGMVLSALEGPELARAISRGSSHDTDEFEEAIASDESVLEQLARDHYSDRLITRSEYLAARDAIEGRLESAKRRRAQASGTAVLEPFFASGAGFQQRWPSIGMDRQRAVIAAVIDRVVIHPAVKGRKAFDPDRVEVIWRV